MTAEVRQLEVAPGPGRLASPKLRTLVVCDIADSTALVERMGDQHAANIIRKHDRLARALIEQHRGREIDKTDGFLLMFERPVQAAAFALDYQHALKHMSAADGVVVRARVGIHMGDVVIWENSPEDVARGAKPMEVEGQVKPIAARLAQLARPQQILMSSAAAGIAHRAEGELGRDAAAHLRWKSHGRYRFKGVPEPIEVVEVGDTELAPLHAPKSGRTARRILPWWRRPVTLAAEAAMLAVAVGVGAWLLLQSPPTLAFSARDWVVVGDLHNLTGDKVFDQSVDSALRISLEQSRYVNVLPELSVQQTLKRMERNPDKTPVYRTIGSEIAVRDGARALILPTVAEVGGRLRVTAEVIDPNTQTTVYSISADGRGAQSVLPSVDSVSKQLRGKLGEALAMVSKQSMPLAQVATSSLDALRAYSLAENAYGVEHYKDAIRLYQQALAIDPRFALARIGLARIALNSNDPQAAADAIDKAAALRNRLSTREGNYVAAWQATLQGTPDEALAKWETLSQMYPDDFTASADYAYFSWLRTNAFDNKTIATARQALSPHNPRPNYSHVLLGMLYLGNERYDAAAKQFAAARSGGLDWFLDYSLVDAAQRKFAAAQKLAVPSDHSGVMGADLDSYIPRIALAADQGDFDSARKLLDTANGLAKQVGVSALLQYQGIGFGLASVRSGSLPNDKFGEYAKALEHALADSSPVERPDLKVDALFAAFLAARSGNLGLSDQLVAAVSAAGANGAHSQIAMLMNVAKAERVVMSGKPKAAIGMLTPQLDGNELCLTHLVLLDAYAAEHDTEAAMAQARWLAKRRGRAYSEWSVPVAIPFAVMHSDLALLRMAELSAVMGNHSAAQSSLLEFMNAWPSAKEDSYFAARIRALQKGS
jgi:putative peptide modification system cyclase